MLEVQSARHRPRPLLACDACRRSISLRGVDDVAAAAIRAGWRVVAVDPAGAHWLCPDCALPVESGQPHDERTHS